MKIQSLMMDKNRSKDLPSETVCEDEHQQAKNDEQQQMTVCEDEQQQE